jgi:hypothetical protein
MNVSSIFPGNHLGCAVVNTLCRQSRTVVPMFQWLKKKARPAPEPATFAWHATSGQYLPLHLYLLNRYANRVVLTFSEIEDLLGFALPHRARLDPGWWAVGRSRIAGPQRSDTWTLANRTATPNLLAQSVMFERA